MSALPSSQFSTCGCRPMQKISDTFKETVVRQTPEEPYPDHVDSRSGKVPDDRIYVALAMDGGLKAATRGDAILSEQRARIHAEMQAVTGIGEKPHY